MPTTDAPAPAMPSLDGRQFDMVSSTASRVDPDAPTRFRYRQQGALIWGEYAGDTVTAGAFVGVRTGDELSITFGHIITTNNDLVTGSADSRITQGQAGALELVEIFGPDGDQSSICREVTAD